MIDLADLVARPVAPLLALGLTTGLLIASVSRDLGKRLFGAGLAALAALAGFAALTGDDEAAAAGVILAGGGLMVGLACLIRIRESFGGIDAGGLRMAESADADAERDA
jgi:hypothetical protein